MRKSMNNVIAAAVLVASVAAASVLYAHDPEGSNSHDMMGSGMMNMMGEMSEMMESCNRMMQGMTGDGTAEPNDQWRKETPVAPDQGN